MNLTQEWDALREEWMGRAFNDIDAEAIGVQVTQYLKVAVRAERGLPGNLVAPKLKQLVEEFKQLLPAVVDLRNKCLKPRHWEAIESTISHKFDPEHTYTLGELLGLNIMAHQEAIALISTQVRARGRPQLPLPLRALTSPSTELHATI